MFFYHLNTTTVSVQLSKEPKLSQSKVDLNTTTVSVQFASHQ